MDNVFNFFPSECISSCSREYDPVCDSRTGQNYFNGCIRNCVFVQRQLSSDSKNDILKTTANYLNWETDCGRVTNLQRNAKLICPSVDRIDEK